MISIIPALRALVHEVEGFRTFLAGVAEYDLDPEGQRAAVRIQYQLQHHGGRAATAETDDGFGLN
jgi:hypothetical protein